MISSIDVYVPKQGMVLAPIPVFDVEGLAFFGRLSGQFSGFEIWNEISHPGHT